MLPLDIITLYFNATEAMKQLC